MAAAALLFSASAATAATLQVPDNAPLWIQYGASVVLALHIMGGGIGIVSGAIASVVRKGARWHVLSGKAFYYAMFMAYALALCTAPFVAQGRLPNTIAALVALYLLVSGISAAKRRNFIVGHREHFGLLVAAAVLGMGIFFAYSGARSPTGTVDGTPPEAFIVFMFAGGAAAFGELRVMVRGSLSTIQRKKRHAWRISTSFFIASGSFFIGQPQVFPTWFNESLLPAVLAFAPLLVMVFWLFKLRAPNPHKTSNIPG